MNNEDRQTGEGLREERNVSLVSVPPPWDSTVADFHKRARRLT